MKISNLFSSLKKNSFILQYLIAIIPVFLVVGVIGQITILSKYNAIAFFSWGQVLNDTSILLLPLIIYFLGIIASYFYFLNETTKKEKIYSSILLFLFFIIVGGISSGIFKNNYFISFVCSFFLGYFSYIMNFIIGDRGKHPGKNDNYVIPVIFNLLILLIVFLIGWMLNYFYSFLYQNIEIKVQNTSTGTTLTGSNVGFKNYEVKYMNDKYILYSSGSEVKIIPNDGKNEFIIKDLNKPLGN